MVRVIGLVSGLAMIVPSGLWYRVRSITSNNLVVRQELIDEYSRFNLIRASALVN
jgi:hypothetical protein